MVHGFRVIIQKREFKLQELNKGQELFRRHLISFNYLFYLYYLFVLFSIK